MVKNPEKILYYKQLAEFRGNYFSTEGTVKKVEEMIENKISPTKKPDVDNIAKSILDAMNNFVFKDDNQVSKISVEKRFALEEKAVIEVEEY